MVLLSDKHPIDLTIGQELPPTFHYAWVILVQVYDWRLLRGGLRRLVLSSEGSIRIPTFGCYSWVFLTGHAQASVSVDSSRLPAYHASLRIEIGRTASLDVECTLECERNLVGN